MEKMRALNQMGTEGSWVLSEALEQTNGARWIEKQGICSFGFCFGEENQRERGGVVWGLKWWVCECGKWTRNGTEIVRSLKLEKGLGG